MISSTQRNASSSYCVDSSSGMAPTPLVLIFFQRRFQAGHSAACLSLGLPGYGFAPGAPGRGLHEYA